MEAIELKLGNRYSDLFLTTREEFNKTVGEIKGEVGNSFSDEAIKCYIYENLSLFELSPMLMDDSLEEIMVVGTNLPVYVYQRGKGMKYTRTRLEEDEIRRIIKKISWYSGRKVSSESPLLDARLPDGSRVNATLGNVSPRGPTLTIRKFRRQAFTIADLINNGTLTAYSAAFLWLAVEGLHYRPANCLIIGGTASGKTTTLNALSAFIPADERTISIEDVQEIDLETRHWIPLETRPPDIDGREIAMDDLLKNALRMRPDRIIVGEVRAQEALTLFTAMNIGHDGTLATLHANSAKETLSRLRSHPMNVPSMMITALDFIIAMKRQVRNGRLRRKVFEIIEVSGTEGDNILTNTLFQFDNRARKLKEVIMGGRYMEELSSLTNMKISEIKEEIKIRESLLKVMADKNYSQEEIHRITQLYYKDPEKAVEKITGKGRKAGGEGGILGV